MYKNSVASYVTQLGNQFLSILLILLILAILLHYHIFYQSHDLMGHSHPLKGSSTGQNNFIDALNTLRKVPKLLETMYACCT